MLTSKIVGIYDKGKAAVVVERVDRDTEETGEPLYTNRSSAFIRGEGGWGGDRGPCGRRERAARPRAPITRSPTTTSPDQALVYRLSGDRNPLHSDPSFAAMGGFDRPILHGLCTYGFTGRALLHALCGSDPARFKHMEGRFSSPVFPGDALTISMWVSDGEAVFTTAAAGRHAGDRSRSLPLRDVVPRQATFTASRRSRRCPLGCSRGRWAASWPLPGAPSGTRAAVARCTHRGVRC